MARNNTTTINLAMSASQASQTLKALEGQAKNLRTALQAAVDAGDKAKSKKLQGDLRQTEGLLRRMRTEAASAADVLSRLDKATPKELKQTLSSLNRQLQNLPRGSQEFAEMAAKIRSVKDALRDVNSEMAAQPSLWERMKNAGTGAVAMAQKGLSIMLNMAAKAEQYVNDYAGMQEQMAGVQKYSGMSADEVGRLNDEFKKMDTRTARENLNLLAQDAGRLGKTSVEDVLGFVRAADQINVALDDLGDGATLTLSKITGLFGVEEEFGTEKALLKAGSVINELSQNCSASAPYIAEFTTRLAATGKTANMTIPQIMAYAAVLDEAGVNVEQSSTAVSKLILKLFQEPGKYAKAAGLELNSWYATLQKDANEGFIQFLEALKSKGGVDAIAPLLKEMGESGIGAMNAINLLSGSLDKVRGQQEAANQAFNDGTSITKEFNVANNTVAAQLDKNKNQIHETAVAIGEQLLPVYNLFASSTKVAMQAVSWLVKVLMDNKAAIVGAAIAWGTYRTAMALANAETKIAMFLQQGLTIVSGTMKAGSLLASAGVNALTGNLTRASAAMRMFSSMAKGATASIGGPIAIAIGVAMGLFWKMAQDVNASTEAIRKHREMLNTYNNQLKEVDKTGEAYAKREVARLNELYAAATDETKSKKERIQAANDLIKLYPAQLSKFSAEQIALGKCRSAYDDLTVSIIDNAKARAAAEKVLENEKKILEIDERITTRNEEIRTASNEKFNKQVRNNARAARASASASTVTGAIAMQQGSTAQYTPESTAAETKLIRQKTAENKTDKEEKAALEKSNARLTSRYKDNQNFKSNIEAGRAGTLGNPGDVETPGVDYSGGSSAPPKSKAERAAEERERKKAEAAARRAEAKAKKEFKEGLESIEGDRDAEDAKTMAEWRTGIISYDEYRNRLHDSEINMFDEKIKYYEDRGMKEDDDAAEFEKKKEKSEAAWSERKKKEDIAGIKRNEKADISQAELDYTTTGTELFRNEEALQEKIFKIRVDALEKIRDQYDSTTEEYAAKQAEIDEMKNDDQIRRQKKTAEDMMKYSLEYRLQDIQSRENMEMAALEALHDKELMSEEDYQRALKELRAKFRKEREDADPSTPKANTTKDYSASSEWGSIVVSMTEAVTMQLDESESKLVAWSKKVSAIAQAAFAAISAVSQAVSSYMSAQIDYETAVISKSYDKRIKAARNNSKLQERLEAQKEKAIAKAKAKAVKENFALQVSMAVAQTAANAISAYGSVVGIPVVGPTLAPIAAALAVAAGMVQIATIKKQADTAAVQGYAAGGFTPEGERDKEVGVVHAGEWVASQKLVKNPRVRPILNALQYAQEHNTFPAISARDVSRTVTAPTVAAYAVPQTAPAPQSSGAFSERRESNDGALQETLKSLRETLADGIRADVSMTGKRGIAQETRRYNQIMSNRKIR